LSREQGFFTVCIGGDCQGPSADELIDMVAAVAAVAGRERFGRLAFVAVPPAAVSLHVIASYVLLHALAATLVRLMRGPR
jgi:hypothetical protein